MFAIALVVAIVGALAVGVPISTVAFALLVLCCPLMMLVMHGVHGGEGHGGNRTDAELKADDEQRPAALR